MKNGVMMQYFEWYMPNDGSLWRQLRDDAEHLAQLGITAVWVPPAYKGMTQNSVGYSPYDLYDFGEFDQKGTTRTKYGTRREFAAAVEALHRCHISVYLDTVLNHKAGADAQESFYVKRVDDNNRYNELSDPYEIEAWTAFTFPGRGSIYSDFRWHWYHFSGVDYDARRGQGGVFKVQGEGKDWCHSVDHEKGNYDYLMFANIDYRHPDVVQEMLHWGRWVVREFGIDGFRLDAVKHITRPFIRHFLDHVREHCPYPLYAVGEFWKCSHDDLAEFLRTMDGRLDLFDVPLHYNLHEASCSGSRYDLGQLMEHTLVQDYPTLSVTFVDNHDSQPGQALESAVQDWFKPAAYAIILLQKEGYPCIFYGDYYGVGGASAMHRGVIDTLLQLRQRCAYGDQWNYFDHRNTVGFVRPGSVERPGSGLALLISNADDGYKWMHVGAHHAHEEWVEATGCCPGQRICIGDDGAACFYVPSGKLAVWVPISSAASCGGAQPSAGPYRGEAACV